MLIHTRFGAVSRAVIAAASGGVGCASEVPPPVVEPEGTYSATYSELSQDCFSARGILLPPRMVFSGPDSAVTLTTWDTETTLESDWCTERLAIKVWSTSPRGSVHIEGGVLKQDGAQIHGRVVIAIYAGAPAPVETALCTATAWLELSPRPDE